MKLYLPLCDNVMCFDNSTRNPELIFKKAKNEPIEILHNISFNCIQNGK